MDDGELTWWGEKKKGTNIRVFPDGYHISRRCDWIMYAVEAEYIDAVVKKYGPGSV